MRVEKRLETFQEFEEFLSTQKNIKLFGAGNTTVEALGLLKKTAPGLLKNIRAIVATSVYGKPPHMENIPVLQYDSAAPSKKDWVILMIQEKYYGEVSGMLEASGAKLVEFSGKILYEDTYQKVLGRLKPFIDGYPGNTAGLEIPRCTADGTLRAWSMWWQGEEQAPEIVKACLRSQRSRLPPEVEYTVITEENYEKYVRVPRYIMEKVARGDISRTHLSDIIRWMLLYQYGGLWMDATILLVKPVKEEIFDYPIYTLAGQMDYCGTDMMWTIPFMAAKPGEKLFHFLTCGFFDHLKEHDTVMEVDYLMSDYMIGIAYNTYPDVREKMRAIPQVRAKRVFKNTLLIEPYDAERFQAYMREADWLKMTWYKHDGAKEKQVEDRGTEGTLYDFICKNF